MFNYLHIFKLNKYTWKFIYSHRNNITMVTIKCMFFPSASLNGAQNKLTTRIDISVFNNNLHMNYKMSKPIDVYKILYELTKK